MKIVIAFLFVLLLCPLRTVQAQENKKIIVMNQYWAKEGMIDEVYNHRLYASEVRKNLGLKVGRVLLITKSDNESAHVIWECEYPSIEAREKDTQLLMESESLSLENHNLAKMVQQNCERMNLVIKNVLSLSGQKANQKQIELLFYL